jgi:hypothetical protein
VKRLRVPGVDLRVIFRIISDKKSYPLGALLSTIINQEQTQYSQRIELNYFEWGASATNITSFIGSGVLLLA